MAKNLIFDFGAVLIPIEEQRTHDAFKALGAKDSLSEQTELFKKYEIGELNTDAFLKALQPHFFRSKIFKPDLAEAWSAVCYAPLPAETLAFLQQLKKKGYKLFLLSNTNALHIKKIKERSGLFDYKRFTKFFEQVYYSHELGTRKPDKAIYQKILDDHQLRAEDCFFTDDKKKNVKAAAKLGMHTFHFQPEEHNLKTLQKQIDKLA